MIIFVNMKDTLEYRKNLLLNNIDEVELAIEGRTTNLRIFTSKHDKKICFRLDKYNNYGAPLCAETLLYLDKPHPIVTKLNELYGFNRATIEDIDTILELTKDMKFRECLLW